MSHHVLHAINDIFDMKTELSKLFDKYPNIDLAQMGFVEGWEKMAVWE